MKWTQITRRTEDPKLAHFEGVLRAHGVPSRRAGHSWHAPILEVPAAQSDTAWALLSAEYRGRCYDDIPDDDSVFTLALAS